jgi:hypothetical protein
MPQFNRRQTKRSSRPCQFVRCDPFAPPPSSPLGAFLAGLREAQIRCILIGGAAAVRHGTRLTAVDHELRVLEVEQGAEASAKNRAETR